MACFIWGLRWGGGLVVPDAAEDGGGQDDIVGGLVAGLAALNVHIPLRSA
jgi:hypothetical protein